MTARLLISLLLPTRKRPELARRFLHSVQSTAKYPDDVEIIIYADDDDAGSHDLDCAGLRITRIIGPRRTMGSYNTACLERARGDIIALVNDDVVIRTPGWDEALRRHDASVPDKIYLAYGDDQFKGQRLSTFPILSRRTCDILQEPYHRAYRGAFIDYHLMDIFKRLEQSGRKRIFYLPDVVFEHLHYRAGKAEIDETYTARGRFEDDMLFVGLANVRAASQKLLMNAIDGETDTGARLPVYEPIGRPKTLFHAFYLFSRIFLFERELPLQWRFFMWWWFTARYLAGGLAKRRPLPAVTA